MQKSEPACYVMSELHRPACLYTSRLACHRRMELLHWVLAARLIRMQCTAKYPSWSAVHHLPPNPLRLYTVYLEVMHCTLQIHCQERCSWHWQVGPDLSSRSSCGAEPGGEAGPEICRHVVQQCNGWACQLALHSLLCCRHHLFDLQAKCTISLWSRLKIACTAKLTWCSGMVEPKP